MLALAVGSALLPWTVAHADVAANALPTGGQYAYGSGSITQQGESKLQITQSTDKGTINWASFSIGSGAWVNFSQPSASSITVNRVLGNNPSEVFGRMTANGQVFLSNPNGVLFAPSASVDVGALFATTLTISDQDANAGRYNKWSNPGNSGAVVNRGSIITANGYTALAGPQVRNDGLIVAHAGTVALAAGNEVSLDMIGDGLIKLSVDQAALNASAINSGTIQADGGNVLLTARSANALLDTVVNNSGVIRANSLIEKNGEIVLEGGSSGIVANSGILSAPGVDAGTTGGTAKVLGQYVSLDSGTRIDVSGNNGGGTILIGGDFQGKNADVQNATTTVVQRDAVLNADAVTLGDGGKIIVWSNDTTHYYGYLSARGGIEGGNGGFAEISGKRYLDLPYLAKHVDMRARIGNGRSGTVLLDPNVININAGAGDGNAGTGAPNSSSPNVTEGTGSTTNLAAGEIVEVLEAGTSVVLTTTDIKTAQGDDINVNTSFSWNGTGNLTLAAGDDVNMNSNTITPSGGGALTINQGDVDINVNAADRSKTYGDAFTFGAVLGTDITLDGTTPLKGGDSLINALASGGAAATAHRSAGDVATGQYSITQGSLAVDNSGSGRTYFVNFTNGTLTVNAAPLTITPDNQTKTYGSAFSFLGTEFTTSAMPNGDSIASVTLASTGAAATAHRSAGDLDSTNGVFSITGSTPVAAVGTELTDYTISFATPSAVGPVSALTVNPKIVNLAGTRTYDSSLNFTAAGASWSIGGTIGTETLNVVSGSGSVASKNVAAGVQTLLTGSLTLGDGSGLASDYTLAGGTHTGNINTPASIASVSGISGVNKTYDGNTNAPLDSVAATFNGKFAGDVLTVATATGTFADKNVGSAKPVSITSISLGGADAGNYTLASTTASTSADVTRLGTSVWTGGGGNNLWSNAANWGGAIPDLANVANVNLNGASVVFDSSVTPLSGSVQVVSVSNGSLTVASGTLNTPSMSLTDFTQTGGTIIAPSNLSITATGTLTPGTITVPGAVTLTAGTLSAGGPISANSGTFGSNSNVATLNLTTTFAGKSVLLTGSATSWTLCDAAGCGSTMVPPAFSKTSTDPVDIFFNGVNLGSSATVVSTITGSIGSTVAQIASQALQDALDTDSVQKQIDYGFAGDVGTTPPMDHRIDQTGISTPHCLEESREGEPCPN
jgi:filamentous hemagglutinin family protein